MKVEAVIAKNLCSGSELPVGRASQDAEGIYLKVTEREIIFFPRELGAPPIIYGAGGLCAKRAVLPSGTVITITTD